MLRTFEYYLSKHNIENQQRNLFQSIEPNFLNIPYILPYNAYQKPVGVFSVDNTGKDWDPGASGSLGVHQSCFPLALRQNGQSSSSWSVVPRPVASGNFEENANSQSPAQPW